MKEISSKFKSLRIKLRKHGKEIAEDVFIRFHPSTKCNKNEICVFCNSTIKITKEHVLPKWLFEHDTTKTAISSVNKLTLAYNNAVIPTCSKCNNEILSHIEIYIIDVVKKTEANVPIVEDRFCLIRWLEILDYKLQVLECRKRYIKYANSEFDPLWSDFPIGLMRHFFELNPFKAQTYLRSSQRRITVKNKLNKLNSLVIFNTPKGQFSFFNKVNEYIFISFPMCKVALFYFYKKEFADINEAAKEAYYIINKVVNSD